MKPVLPSSRFRKSKPKVHPLIQLALIAAAVLIIWGVFFTKSGFFYQQGILRSLNSTYQSKFVIVSKEGLNEDGYQVLQAAPANDRSLVFTVNRENGHVDGGLPLWRQVSDNYEDVALMKYYPLLVKKHFGIEIEDVPVSIYSGVNDLNEPPDESYIEVTRDNLDDIALKSEAFFKEAQRHRLKNLLFRFKHDMSFVPVGYPVQQRFEVQGFGLDRGQHWKKDIKPLSAEEIKQDMVRQIGRGIAERIVYAFETENPDFKRNFDLTFPANDLTSLEGTVSVHTITAEQREESLAEIYQAYTKALAFVEQLPKEFQMTSLHLQYATNTETESVSLPKEEWSTLNSLDAMKELFNHSQKTDHRR